MIDKKPFYILLFIIFLTAFILYNVDQDQDPEISSPYPYENGATPILVTVDLYSEPAEPGVLTIYWNSLQDVDSWRLYRSGPDLPIYEGTATSFVDRYLISNLDYEYWVVALKDGQEVSISESRIFSAP